MNISQQPFGFAHGTPVQLYTLSNDHGIEVRITNYGGIITHLFTPDVNGARGDIVLGHDTLERYFTASRYFGCLVGRYANRIADGRFSLNNKSYTLAQNNGSNHLHGGQKGFDQRVWQPTISRSADAVMLGLAYMSLDGEEGYPGNLLVTATYTLSNDNTLRIDYAAQTDAPTVVNLTNHTYFNLSLGKSNILDHELQLMSDAITPVNERLIPTGELLNVRGTPFDFETPHKIGERINADHAQLKYAGGYDHNYIVRGAAGEMRLAARVRDPLSGRTLEVHTTEPGIQFYSGNFLDDSLRGKNDVTYGLRSGFCLETQHYPDSPNQPQFPSTVLLPMHVYRSSTVFRLNH
jgi:aldose 1-epimerase